MQRSQQIPPVSPASPAPGSLGGSCSIGSGDTGGSASGDSDPSSISSRQLCHSLCWPLDEATKRRQCRYCTSTFAESSTSSTLSYHFKIEHPIVWKAQSASLFTQPRASSKQPTLNQVLDSKALNDGFQDVVDSFIAHPGLPLSLANCPAYRRTLKFPQRVSSQSIRNGIVAKDAAVLRQLQILLQGKLVGLQIDGGKTVSKNKVLGVGFTLQGTFYCWAILHCDGGTVWNEQYYCNIIKELIRDIESFGALVVSVTADNEPSLSAGIELLQQELRHLVHIRCFAHTCELLVADLQKDPNPAIPMLHSVGTACKELVTFITNNKYVNTALERVQGDKPLVLLKPSNTRKWSSLYLVCSRVLRLYSYIEDLENHIAAGASIPTPPSAQHLTAKREWVEAKARLLPNKLHLEAIVQFLYWIYVAEQVLQRDVSCLIHAAHLYESLCACLGQSPTARRVPTLLSQSMDVTAVAGSAFTRRETLKRSNVYMLALFMWPNAVYDTDNFQSASRELKAFVTLSWRKWQENADNLELPAAMRVVDISDTADVKNTLQAFLLQCARELTLVTGNTHDIKLARDEFLNECAIAVSHQTRTAGTTKRGRTPGSAASALANFWLAVAPTVPHLFIIVKVLLATCATEAAVERMFSKEGFIHDKTRNRLSHEFVQALVRCCINSKSFSSSFPSLLHELFDDEDDEDDEDDDEDGDGGDDDDGGDEISPTSSKLLPFCIYSGSSVTALTKPILFCSL